MSQSGDGECFLLQQGHIHVVPGVLLTTANCNMCSNARMTCCSMLGRNERGGAVLVAALAGFLFTASEDEEYGPGLASASERVCCKRM